MNPDLLEQLRALMQQRPDATRAPVPQRQPVPTMRAQMPNAMPIAPEPSLMQRTVSFAQELVPGIGEAISGNRIREDIEAGRPGRAALEGALLAAGAVPVVGDAAAKVFRNPAREMRRIAPRAIPAEQQQAFNKFFGESKVRTPEGQPMVVVHGTPASHLGKGIDEVDDFRSFRLPKEGKEQLGIHVATDPRQTDYFTSYDPHSNMFSERWPVAPPDEQLRYSYNNIKSYGRSIPMYARVQNPLRLPDLGNWSPPEVLSAMQETNPEAYRRVVNVVRRENKKLDELTERELRNVLELAGYDGIVYRNRFEGLPIPVALEMQKKLKSLTKSMAGHESEIDEALDASLKEMWPEAGDAYIVFRPNQLKSAIGNRGTFDRRWKDISRGIVGMLTGGAAANAAQPSQPENP